MAYNHHIINGRWTQAFHPSIGSYFCMRLGNSGRNGAAVPSYCKNDQDYIQEILKSKGIELVESVEDGVPENGMWWHFEKYAYHVPIENKGPGPKKQVDTMYYGGYAFKMGKAARETLKKK